MKSTITQLLKSLSWFVFFILAGSMQEQGFAQTLTQVPNPSGKFFSNYQATDNAGNHYYTFRNGAGGSTFTLYKYNGTTLTEIPNPSGLTAIGLACKASNGTLYFFYQNASNQAILYKYDGTTLTAIPNPTGVTASGFIGEESNGNLLFRYINSAPRGALYRYNGTTMTAVGGDPHANLINTLTIDNGTFYLFYFDLGNIAHMVKFNGTSFTDIPNPGGYAVSSFSAKDNSGNLYFHYTNNSTFLTEVYKYNGTTLTQLSTAGYNNGFYSTKDNSGNLYIRFTNTSTNQRTLFKYDGTTLTPITNPTGFTFNRYEAIDNSGNLYFRYRDASNSNFLYRYDGSNLTAIPNPSGLTLANFAIKDNAGVMYFKYQDASFNGILARLNGTTITTIANPSGLYMASQMSFSSSNDIYVRYTDASFNNGTLYYYNGSLNVLTSPSGLMLLAFSHKDNNNILHFQYDIPAGGSGVLCKVEYSSLTTWYRDLDGDTFGDPANTTQAASQPVGYVANNTDCDDNDPLEKPGQVWYKDADNDGYGETGAATITQCLRPVNYKAAGELTATTGDCNDNNAAIKPGATEVCDGVDNNCNGMTDEGGLTTWYRDMDSDGFGNPAMTQTACTQPVGYVANNTDCNDLSAFEKPGQIWYKDTDGDSYAQTGAATITQCLRPVGYKAASELTSTTGDCNDNNFAIKPGATEVCDGVDNNCNGMTDEGGLTTYYADVDADGFGNPASSTQACSQPGGYVANNTDCNDLSAIEKPGQVWYKDADNDGFGETGAATITQCLRPVNYKAAGELTATTGDCNDANAAIKPGAAEVCDGVDNNCNGMTDEGGLTTYYADVDADGFGNPSATQQACSQPVGYVANNTDCNDLSAVEKPGQVWYKDADNDGYGETGAATITQCLRPVNYKAAGELTATTGDCNDANAAIKPGAAEVCDGVDNNCNGSTDEGVLTTYYQDSDTDGFGNPSATQQACSQPVGYVANNTDCNDLSAIEKPGQVWYKDADNDGYAETGAATITQCLRPVNYKAAGELTATTGDCNDANAAIKPGATEVCDGVDNNCNGSTDEGVLTTYYQDSDMDGFGNPSATQQACSQPVGYVANNTDCNDLSAVEKPGQVWYKDADNDGYAETGAATITQCLRPVNYKAAGELTATTGDCNDGNAAIKPSAAEVCDGVDNNCNGMTDEGVLTTYYQDSDMDGFGNPSATQQACSQPVGYVANNTDCNDLSAVEKPGQVWYKDADNDGYAETGAATITQCLRPSGYKILTELVAATGDCNDGNAAIKPGATEVCDGVDNNCNGMTDEGVLTTYYADVDADGFGNPSSSTLACSQSSGYVTNNTDCNDNDNTIYPGATDICDGKDNDCDGTTDEGGTGPAPGWGVGTIGGATNATSSFMCNSGSPSGTVFNITSQGFSGAANADLINSNYQQRCGDASITAHIASSPAPGWAGIYIREDLTPGSKMVALKTNLSSFLRREVRATVNGNKTTAQNPLYASNSWVRIERTGNTFAFYSSPNGATWSLVGSTTVTMGSCVYIGLFAESINAATTINASFDNVAITGGAAPLAIAPGLGFEAQEENQSFVNQILVYPNPSTGLIQIGLQDFSGKAVRIKVSNSFGSTVLNKKLEEALDTESLDLSAFAPGVYWLQVQAEGSNLPLVQKVILSR